MKQVNSSFGTRDQEEVAPSTVGDSGAESSDIVTMTLGDLREIVIIEVKKGLDSSTVTAVRPVAADPVSGGSSH